MTLWPPLYSGGCFGPLIDLVLVGPRTPGWLPPFTHVFENPRNKACLAWRLATPLRCLQPATVASTQSLAVHVACGVVVAATAPALPATLPARDCLSLRPTVPVIPAHLNMRGMAQSGVPASAELRMSAATFTPGEKEHKTPIKTTSAVPQKRARVVWRLAPPLFV